MPVLSVAGGDPSRCLRARAKRAGTRKVVVSGTAGCRADLTPWPGPLGGEDRLPDLRRHQVAVRASALPLVEHVDRPVQLLFLAKNSDLSGERLHAGSIRDLQLPGLLVCAVVDRPL